jgi:hypothetical protein
VPFPPSQALLDAEFPDAPTRPTATMPTKTAGEDALLHREGGITGLVVHSAALGASMEERAEREATANAAKARKRAQLLLGIDPADQDAFAQRSKRPTTFKKMGQVPEGPPMSMLESVAQWMGKSVEQAARQVRAMSAVERADLRKRYGADHPY